QLYGRRHVATAGAVCNLQEAIRQAAAEDGEARIAARGRRLQVNGETMRGRECGALALGYLAAEWSKRGIDQVRFQKEATTEELEAFVAAFLDVDVTRPEPADRLAAALVNESVGGVIVEKLAADEREPVLLEERRESVMRAYLRGLRAFKEVLRCDGLRDRAKIRRARRAVQGVVDSFLEDESAVLALAQIRSFDLKLFHHSLNTCVLAVLIGQRLHLPRRQLADLGLAALFHDVGKTTPGNGTAAEEERAHTARGARMLLEEGTTHEGMLKAAIAAYEHHAGADRSGFPTIPHDPHLVSRIVAVADAYDSLTAPPAPLAPPDALARMLARKDLDPLLVKVFVNAIGIYPVGSVVELTTGETAIVASPPTPEAFDRPRVKVVKRGAGALEPDALVELGGDGPRVARALPAGAFFGSVLEHVSAL
ncbi:MAG TPA: HD domain-containing protein, partial [Planctomycetota bacterium]|nr:HD domain-containing protein [Planctomycetota bacterium]